MIAHRFLFTENQILSLRAAACERLVDLEQHGYQGLFDGEAEALRDAANALELCVRRIAERSSASALADVVGKLPPEPYPTEDELLAWAATVTGPDDKIAFLRWAVRKAIDWERSQGAVYLIGSPVVPRP